MKIKEYSEKALTTAIYPNRGKNLAYASLGLIEELMETVEKIEKKSSDEEIVKELGDVLWYMNAICFEIKHSLEAVASNAALETSLDCDVSQVIQTIAGKTKKHIRDDNGELDPKKRDSIIEGLNQIFNYVDQKAQIFNSSVSEVCEKNIDKLFSRKARGKLKGSGDNR